MLQGFGRNHRRAQQLGRRPRRATPAARLVGALILVGSGALVAGAGCSSPGDSLTETLDGWSRSEAWEHDDVIPFDNVAATSYRDTLAWVTRGGTDHLVYWQVREDGPVLQVELPTPDAPVAIPVAVAQDSHRWAVAAVTRDTPAGLNTGAAVWVGDATTDDPVGEPAQLLGPRGTDDQPEVVSVARTTDVTVAVGLAAGQPLVWRHQTSGTGEGAPVPDRWRGERLDLDVDAELTSLRVAGDGERFVLAGTDEDGQARLWTSSDGESWEATGADLLPRDVGRVDALSVLDTGDMLLAWMGPDGTPAGGATEVAVWRLEGSDLTSLGTLRAADAEDDLARIEVDDATLAPDDHVLVVGQGIRDDDSSVPLAWSRRDDEWQVTDQEDLTTRLDHQLRAVASTTDDEMTAVMTHVSFSDVELWRWHRD